MKAVLSADRSHVFMAGRQWQGVFPVEELDVKIAFYRGLAERKDARYARHYAPDLAALEGVKRRLAA